MDKTIPIGRGARNYDIYEELENKRYSTHESTSIPPLNQTIQSKDMRHDGSTR